MFFQFNFSIKIYFYYFLVPDLRDEKERLSDSSSKEKKISLITILVTKTIDFYVK